MEWPGRKLAAFGMLLLLFGAAPALACNSEAPHSHEWPGGVDSPRPMPSREIRHQLQILLANRDKWDLYEGAVNEMLEKTSTEFAPWHILESVDKKYARIKALRIVVGAVENVLDGAVLVRLVLRRASAQFTIMPANRQDWLQKEPARVIHMLRDSYENYAGIKEGFG